MLLINPTLSNHLPLVYCKHLQNKFLELLLVLGLANLLRPASVGLLMKGVGEAIYFLGIGQSILIKSFSKSPESILFIVYFLCLTFYF